MKKKILFTAMSSVMALGMLTACGTDENRMNNDGDVDYRPVRYNQDNNMDGNRENYNGVFDNDNGLNNRNNRGENSRNSNVLNRNDNGRLDEFGDNEIDRNSTRGMTDRSDGRGMFDGMDDNNDRGTGTRGTRGYRGMFSDDDTNGMTDNERNGLGGMNGNLSGNR